MKIMLCGGGTAGHVYPAMAMAEIIKSKYYDASFLFVGRRGGAENDIPRSSGIPVETIEISGIDRKNPLRAFGGIVKSLRALWHARRIIKAFSPNIVIGTGGYVSWPVISAAKGLGIRTIIHESNAYPGLVTRMLAKKCNLTLLGFNEARAHIKRARDLQYLGNPTRAAFGEISRREARRRLGIPSSAFLTVSFGGSLGAELMNKAISESIISLSEKHRTYFHVHATGKRYYESVIEEHPRLKSRSGSRIIPYMENVPLWFSAADLAITRSGAITLAELSASGLPAILIPSPNVADDHQTANARACAECGGAILLPEAELTPDRLTSEIEALIDNPKRLLSMRSSYKRGESEKIGERFLALFEQVYPF